VTSKQLRLAFAGTPDLAATVLTHLITNTEHYITSVFTQPDRPAGRGRKPRPSAVKQVTQNFGLEVHQPASRSELAQTAKLEDVDVMVVVAYGLIIPPSILQVPKYGCLNIHTSLLPRWRGAAPIQRAIQYGDRKTGISIMKMDEGLDTGPVMLQSECMIDPGDTAGTLQDKLATLGSAVIIQALDELASGTATYKTQDESQATYAPKITKQEAKLDWNQGADVLERTIRAFNPAPVAYTNLKGQDLRIWEAIGNMNHQNKNAPGNIVSYSKNGIEVACNPGTLLIKRLQIPGKRPMDIAEFMNGRPAFLLS